MMEKKVYLLGIDILLSFFLFFISISFYWGIWNHSLTGKDVEVFTTIPSAIVQITNFFQSQPHTPLAYLTLILTQKFFTTPQVHYFFNWLLHTSNVILLFILLSNKYIHISFKIVAFLFSILFLLHPFSIYSTAFLIHRGGLLAALFTLTFLCIGSKYIKNNSQNKHLPLLYICLYLAVFSHFLAVSLCVVLLLMVLIKIRDKETFFIPLPVYSTILLTLLLSLFVYLSTYNWTYHESLFTTKSKDISYSTQISNFYFLALFPSGYFPLQAKPIEVPLTPLVSIIIIFGLILISIFSYKKKENLLSIVTLLILISSVALTFFQKFDLHENNSYYLVFLNFVLFLYMIFHLLLENFQKLRPFFIGVCFLFIILVCYSGLKLIREVKDPEKLWFACVANDKNNPEGWLYLAREYTKKIQVGKGNESVSREYLEKANQIWDALLELMPENVEGLQNKARLLILEDKYESAKKYIQRAISKDPFDPISYKIKISGLKQKKEHPTKEDLIEIFNCYSTLLHLNPNFTNEEVLHFLETTEKVNNINNICMDWEILKSNLFGIHSKQISTNTFSKYCDELKQFKKSIPYPILNNGEEFSPPFKQLIELHKRKGTIPLYLAWLNFQSIKRTDETESLLELGKYFGAQQKPRRFIQHWANRINSDMIWEDIARWCIANRHFESAEIYIQQTSYSAREQYLKLSQYANELGDNIQSEIWVKKSENAVSMDSTEVKEEIDNKTNL